MYNAVLRNIFEGTDYNSVRSVVADIIIDAKDEEEAEQIAKMYASKKNISYPYISIYKLSQIYTKEILTDANFNKVEARTKSGELLMFETDEEFKKFCHDNKIHYDFESHIMMMDNKIYGVFAGVGQTFTDCTLSVLRKK